MKKILPIILIVLLFLTSCNNIVNNSNETTEPFTTNVPEISSIVGDETTVIDDPTIIITDPPFYDVPADPYIIPRSDNDSYQNMISFLNFIKENGYMSRKTNYDPKSGATPLESVSGKNITAQYGAVNYTSEAMERVGFTTIWVGGHNGGQYFIKVNDTAYELTSLYYNELKFVCPIDITGDGNYEILYYMEFGNVGKSFNQLRLIDPQKNVDLFLADDIFMMNLTPEYDKGEIIDVHLLDKTVKGIFASDKQTWNINEDGQISALRGPSPWIVDAKDRPSTKELNEETQKMYNILKRDGYMTTSGWKSAEEVKPYLTAVLNLNNPTPDSFRLNEDYTVGFELNSKGYAILTADVSSIHHVFFFDKQTGIFYRPNIDSIDDIWFAKPIDIDGDGNLDIVYYGPNSASDSYEYRLMVYDLANNKSQYIARSYKMLPVTYDKDHVYIGGVDVVEYYKTLEVPTKDYYPPITVPKPLIYTETTEAPLVDDVTYSKFYINKNGEICNEDAKRFTLKLPTLGVEHNCTRYRFDSARRVQTKMVLTNIQTDSYPNAENLILTFKFYILDEINEKFPDKLFVLFKVIDENIPDPDYMDVNLIRMPKIEVYPLKTGDVVEGSITLPLNIFADGGSYICMYNG